MLAPDYDQASATASPPATRRVLIASIIWAAGSVYGVSKADVLGNSRQRRYAEPRQVAMYLAVDMRGATQSLVGRVFSRCPSTVHHAYHKIAERIERDALLAGRVEAVRRAARNPEVGK